MFPIAGTEQLGSRILKCVPRTIVLVIPQLRMDSISQSSRRTRDLAFCWLAEDQHSWLKLEQARDRLGIMPSSTCLEAIPIFNWKGKRKSMRDPLLPAGIEPRAIQFKVRIDHFRCNIFQDRFC